MNRTMRFVQVSSTLLVLSLFHTTAMADIFSGQGGGSGKVADIFSGQGGGSGTVADIFSGQGGGSGRSAQLGIQLNGAVANRLSVANASQDGIVFDAQKLNAVGFTGAKNGDMVRVTSVVPGQQWRVMHLGSRIEHTFVAAGQELKLLR